ncbi:MAG TPA: isochorismatase family protein [Gemmatimonadales bacterium]|nr:isochorismatase family protein [Gemmatimonadales bacterium]
MTQSVLEPFTPENTTILMVDYSVGFVNSFRSHNVNEHITATVALAKTALGFRSGLVVNLGAGQKPYPQLVQALGNHPIIYRGGEYNALDSATVLEAVKKTGRERLAISGISTDGCVIETALGARRLGYTVALVEDATAGQTRDTHDICVRRMMQAGVVPVTWLSLATEFQMNWEKKDTAQAYFGLIAEASPGLTMSIETEHAAGAAK